MIVDTETGEVIEAKRRRTFDTRKMVRERRRVRLLEDLVVVLALYGLAATAFIAGLLV